MVIAESNLPMYFISPKQTIHYMNDAARTLLSLEPSAIENKDIQVLIDHVAKLVPKEWQECFRRQQDAMVQLARQGKFPEAQATVPVDLIKSFNSKIRGKYLLWVHADRMFAESSEETVGSLVVVRARKVDEWGGDEINALTKACREQT